MKTKITNLKNYCVYFLLSVSFSYSQNKDPEALLKTLSDTVFSFAPTIGALGFVLSGVWYMMGSDEGKEKAKKVAIGCIIVAVSSGLVSMLMGGN
jgi:hypothetical protein